MTSDTQGRAVGSATLGVVIRDRRQEMGMTLAGLAGDTGLSQSFLSQLENGRTNASLRSLQSIADALGTTATVLLADSDTRDDPVARADDDLLTLSDGGGATVRSLMHGKRQLRALEFSGETHDDREFTHDTDEVLYVVSGTVEATMRSASRTWTVTLGAGDALCVDARLPHRWRGLSADTKVVVVGVADEMAVRRAGGRRRS